MSKIIGIPVGTTTPKPDWNETDPKKGGYIKNKPKVLNGKDGEDGLTPYIGENGNWWIGETDTGELASGYAKELQPLNIKQYSPYNINGVPQAVGTFDGTTPLEFTLPIGFVHHTTDRTIWDIDRPVILNGTYKVHSQQSATYGFTHAIAFGHNLSSARVVYVNDYRSNKHYRFWFDTAYLNGRYDLVEAPLIATNSGATALQPLTFTGAADKVYDGTVPVEIPIPTGGGGNVSIYRERITTTEAVSAISVTLPVPVEKLIMLQSVLVIPTDESGTNPATTNLFMYVGNNGCNLQNTQTSGSLVIGGVRYGNHFSVGVGVRADEHYQHAQQKFSGNGAVVNVGGDTANTVTWNWWGKAIFPAGTKLEFWGLYEL